MECHHRWPFFITNLGLQTWWCKLHHKSVNDDICSTCSDREGETPKDTITPPEDYPRRRDEEIEMIYQVCKGCPLLNKATKVCKSMHPEIHPTDIVAQHPSVHCPERKW